MGLFRWIFSVYFSETSAERRAQPSSPGTDSGERLHRPDGAHDVVERSAPGHDVGLTHQRFEVAGPADFLMLEQGADAR